MDGGKRFDQKSYANFDVTYFLNLAGEHSWKMGLQWARNRGSLDRRIQVSRLPEHHARLGPAGRHLGPELWDGKYGYYAVTGNETTGRQGEFYDAHSDRWAFYLQDSWTSGGS